MVKPNCSTPVAWPRWALFALLESIVPLSGCQEDSSIAPSTRSDAAIEVANDGGVAAGDGVPAESPAFDARLATYPEGYLAWQISGGAVAIGTAVAVSADGWAKVWGPVPYFGSEAPPDNPKATYSLSRAQTDDLFARIARVDFASLPHEPHSGAECYAHFYARLCNACAPTLLLYNGQAEVTPQLESVWQWFDAILTSPDLVRPRDYCRF